MLTILYYHCNEAFNGADLFLRERVKLPYFRGKKIIADNNFASFYFHALTKLSTGLCVRRNFTKAMT